MLATLRTLFVFIPLVTLYTILCGSISLLAAVVFRSGEPSHRIARLWAWLILKTCGVEVDLEGAARLEPGRVYLLAANHQSLFDTPILFACLPVSFRILYKESLTAIPFLGWHLYLAGHIPVDRSNPIRARRSLDRAAERIRRGASVVVFPEGTRSYDGTMGRFKKGSFQLALMAGVPVVPVVIDGSYRVMRRGEVTVHPGRVRVRIEPPIPAGTFDDPVRLAETVRGIVERRLGPPSAGPPADRDVPTGASRAAEP